MIVSGGAIVAAMPRMKWTLMLKFCVAIVIAVSIAISIGFVWAALFVIGDFVYLGWRITAPQKGGNEQKEAKSSWSKTLR